MVLAAGLGQTDVEPRGFGGDQREPDLGAGFLGAFGCRPRARADSWCNSNYRIRDGEAAGRGRTRFPARGQARDSRGFVVEILKFGKEKTGLRLAKAMD